MPRRIKLILAGAIAIAGVTVFYLFGGRMAGGFVFTGQISEIFQGVFNRPQLDRVIWLGGRDDPADSNNSLIAVSEKKTAEKPAMISFCSFGAAKKSAADSVVINEVAWMGSPSNNNAEWLELKNISGVPAIIGGYQVIDKAEQIKFIFPAGTVLPANSFYVLAREKQGTEADGYYSGILANSDEGARLFDSNCNLLNEALAEKNWPGGDNESKKTMERDTAGLWQTSLVAGGTPGRENSVSALKSAESVPPTISEDVQPAPVQSIPTAQPNQPTDEPLTPTQQNEPVQNPPAQPAVQEQPPAPVPQQQIVLRPPLIMEIMAGKDGNSGYEFVELYNPNDSAFDLTGWSLKKRSSTGTESSLVATSRLEGKSIPARSRFLLVNEEGYDGGVAPNVGWPKSYSLAYSNNSIVVYNADGQKIEEVSWAEIPKDKSYERRSADSNEFFIQDSPNPQNS